MSPQIESLTGYTPQEWASEDDFFAQVLHPDDRERVLAAFEAAHRSGGLIQLEYRLIAKDGAVVWIHDDAAVARDPHGGPLYLQGYMADVTARKQAEVDLAKANERLLELDAMKDEFVASVSHELRSPLTSIRGYLELILDDGARLPDDTREYLGVVDRNADRLLSLVNDLLFVASVDAGRLQLEQTEVDLGDVILKSLQAAQPSALRAAVAVRHTLAAVPPISGDASRLAQVVDNLVSNAIKFTPAGGSVTVRLSSFGEMVVVEVADTGMGIPAADLERLFERFFRSRNATQNAILGTGLGLSIVHAIVEAHGGRISATSAEGAGTIFRIELPT